MGKVAKKIVRKAEQSAGPAPLTAAQKKYEEHRKSLSPAERRSPLPHGQKDTPQLREIFLNWLRLGVTPSRAARECGICSDTAWKWRSKDENFAAQWVGAVADGIAKLEDEATRRGVDGVDRPVFQGGECVGFVREYSDDLLKFVLAARDPKRFSRNAQNDGSGGQTSVNFTFNFGTPLRSANSTLHPAVDGALSNGRDFQRQALLDNRSDDQGG